MTASVDLFRGSLVRLAALDAERDAPTLARWSLDSEYLRLLDADPVRPRTAKQWQDDLGRHEGKDSNFPFGIRTLEDDHLIGFVGLWVINWGMAEATVGIGLGDRNYWGRGYGTDAMRLVVNYGFAELNLARVSLEAFAYNTRAIRSYEKAGFSQEGRQRERMRRDGQRLDVVRMGILRPIPGTTPEGGRL
jgi:RimJ/RimL family protein N-acetyltransferase